MYIARHHSQSLGGQIGARAAFTGCKASRRARFSVSTQSGSSQNAADQPPNQAAGSAAKNEEEQDVSKPTKPKFDYRSLMEAYKLSATSTEVGISARIRKQKLEKEVAAAEAATENETVKGSGAMAGDLDSTLEPSEPTQSSRISESWKYLFDESENDIDLVSASKAKHETSSGPGGDSNGLSNSDKLISSLFPSTSSYRSAPNKKSPLLSMDGDEPLTSPSLLGPDTKSQRMDRWKQPKAHEEERDAFKALFASLFENKSIPASMDRRRSSPPSDVDTKQTSSISTPPSSTFGLTEEEVDPMQFLEKQLQSLSARTTPIYNFKQKPKTETLKIWESTVNTEDLMESSLTEPRENSVFASIREGNELASRMSKQLEALKNDLVKVREFVATSIFTPLTLDDTTTDSTAEPKPSGQILDRLLSRAIRMTIDGAHRQPASPLPLSGDGDAFATSILDKISSGDQPDTLSYGTVQPFMAHAFVECARREGLSTFIQTVRTNSYNALLENRWRVWNDCQGCSSLVQEMSQSGVEINDETQRLVKRIMMELKKESQEEESRLMMDERQRMQRIRAKMNQRQTEPASTIGVPVVRSVSAEEAFLKDEHQQAPQAQDQTTTDVTTKTDTVSTSATATRDSAGEEAEELPVLGFGWITEDRLLLARKMEKVVNSSSEARFDADSDFAIGENGGGFEGSLNSMRRSKQSRGHVPDWAKKTRSSLPKFH